MGSALSHYLAFLPWIPLMVDCTCKMNLALSSLSFFFLFSLFGGGGGGGEGHHGVYSSHTGKPEQKLYSQHSEIHVSSARRRWRSRTWLHRPTALLWTRLTGLLQVSVWGAAVSTTHRIFILWLYCPTAQGICVVTKWDMLCHRWKNWSRLTQQLAQVTQLRSGWKRRWDHYFTGGEHDKW